MLTNYHYQGQSSHREDEASESPRSWQCNGIHAEVCRSKLCSHVNRSNQQKLSGGQSARIFVSWKNATDWLEITLIACIKKATLNTILCKLECISKVMHEKMNMICEKNGYHGKVQYGFRSGRSTSDCVFMLLSAVRKANKKGHTVSIAFCDIAKAYDSVNWELLYTEINTIGFGGNVKSLIQSILYIYMYIYLFHCWTFNPHKLNFGKPIKPIGWLVSENHVSRSKMIYWDS